MNATLEEVTTHNLIKELITRIGDDPEREGLVNTPKRVVKSWEKLFGGYKQASGGQLLGVRFKSEGYDEIVLLKNIEFYSTCEHHMLPFYGVAHVAYIPRDWLVGISKLARLVEVYARRLQIQERLTINIAHTLKNYLEPIGAGCVIEAKHHCMLCRGVEKQNSSMVTSTLLGALYDDPRARQEFFDLIKMR
jgi:GTP cyclohydrolase I